MNKVIALLNPVGYPLILAHSACGLVGYKVSRDISRDFPAKPERQMVLSSAWPLGLICKTAPKNYDFFWMKCSQIYLLNIKVKRRKSYSTYKI